MAFGKHLNDTRDLMVLKRYQNRFMHKRRSVAEHMCSTAMIAQWLAFIERDIFNCDVNLGELMQRAINFNSTQVWTGNVLSSTRKISKSMSDGMNSLKKVSFDEYVKPTLPVSWVNDFERYMVYAKDQTLEGTILKAADIIDTILECIEEINLHNKTGFDDILKQNALELANIDLNSAKYVIKYILPKFKNELVFCDVNFDSISSEITFEGADDTLLNEYSIVGDYIYKYRNLMELMRYQNKHMFRRTSVAEHMWSVAKISQGLAIWTENKFGIKVDMGKVLCKAVGHDVGEFITGDILSTTKRLTSKMKEAVDEMEEIIYSEHIAKLIPTQLRSDFKGYILDAKDDSIEGKILAAADIIDTIYECSDEIKLGNKELFGTILQRVTESLLNVNIDSVDYFIMHSLVDIGLDIEEYFGEKVYSHREELFLR